MEKTEKETMENDEPKINYRGVKAMPLIIGDKHNFLSSCICLILILMSYDGNFCINFYQEMRHLRSLEPLAPYPIFWCTSLQSST